MKSKEGVRMMLLIVTMQVLALVLALPTAFAATIQLEWDPSTDPDLAGYKVYYQANSATLPLGGTGASEGSAPVDVADSTSVMLHNLEPGNSYYFAVTAYNSQGVESPYSNLVKVAEAEPPVVAITSPAANTLVQGKVAVAAAASDNVGLASVEFYVDNVLQTAATAAPYTFNWDTSSLGSGTYTLMTKAYDAAGNVGQSTDVAVFVAGDTAAPTVSFSAPAHLSSVSGNVTVSAGASDNVGVTKVEVYDNGALAVASNESTASYVWNTLLSENGLHTLSAKAYDAAGNVGVSANLAVTVANDSIAPTVAIASPAAGASVAGTVELSANASDNVAVTKVDFYANGLLLGSSTTAPFSLSWDTLELPNGSYALTCQAYDAAGNTGQSASRSVTINNPVVDRQPPTVTISSPADGTSLKGIKTIKVTARDNMKVTKVEMYVDGALLATDTTVAFNFSWSTGNYPEGSHTLIAKAYDAAGNVGQSYPVTVQVDRTDPVVTIAAPLAGSRVGSTVAIEASATDDVAVASLQLYIDGVNVTSVAGDVLSWSWDTTGFAAGSHVIKIKALDQAGNVGTKSVTVKK